MPLKDKRKTSSVNVRIEPDLKEQAESILALIGISPSSAIEMLYRRIIMENGWPCDLKVPNDETQMAMHEAMEGIKDE